MFVVVIAVGCTFAPLDLSDRTCPCPATLVCDVARDRCVVAIDDAGRVDVGTDGGPDAAGEDAGAPRCPVDAFCESFEESNLSGNGWTAYPDSATARHVDSRDPDPVVTPFRGSGMLRVSTRSPGSAAELVICPFTGFVCPTEAADAGVVDGGAGPGGADGGDVDAGVVGGVVDGDIWMRAYLLVPTTMRSGAEFVMGHASVMHVGAHRGPFFVGEDVVGFNLDVDHAQMYVGTIGARIEPRPASGMPDTRPPFPRDTWVCVRTHLRLDAARGIAETYLGPDPVPAVIATDVDTVAALPFVHFGIGLGYTSEMVNGAEIYADEVAIGRSEISCLD